MGSTRNMIYDYLKDIYPIIAGTESMTKEQLIVTLAVRASQHYLYDDLPPKWFTELAEEFVSNVLYGEPEAY